MVFLSVSLIYATVTLPRADRSLIYQLEEVCNLYDGLIEIKRETMETLLELILTHEKWLLQFGCIWGPRQSDSTFFCGYPRQWEWYNVIFSTLYGGLGLSAAFIINSPPLSVACRKRLCARPNTAVWSRTQLCRTRFLVSWKIAEVRGVWMRTQSKWICPPVQMKHPQGCWFWLRTSAFYNSWPHRY